MAKMESPMFRYVNETNWTTPGDAISADVVDSVNVIAGHYIGGPRFKVLFVDVDTQKQTGPGSSGILNFGVPGGTVVPLATTANGIVLGASLNVTAPFSEIAAMTPARRRSMWLQALRDQSGVASATDWQTAKVLAMGMMRGGYPNIFRVEDTTVFATGAGVSNPDPDTIDGRALAMRNSFGILASQVFPVASEAFALGEANELITIALWARMLSSQNSANIVGDIGSWGAMMASLLEGSKRLYHGIDMVGEDLGVTNAAFFRPYNWSSSNHVYILNKYEGIVQGLAAAMTGGMNLIPSFATCRSVDNPWMAGFDEDDMTRTRLSMSNLLTRATLAPESSVLNTEDMANMMRFAFSSLLGEDGLDDRFTSIDYKTVQAADAKQSVLTLMSVGDWTDDTGAVIAEPDLAWLRTTSNGWQHDAPMFIRCTGRNNSYMVVRQARAQGWTQPLPTRKPNILPSLPPLILWNAGNKPNAVTIRDARFISRGKGRVTPLTTYVVPGVQTDLQEGNDDQSLNISELDAFFG
jgi:hypothetical protein